MLNLQLKYERFTNGFNITLPLTSVTKDFMAYVADYENNYTFMEIYRIIINKKGDSKLTPEKLHRDFKYSFRDFIDWDIIACFHRGVNPEPVTPYTSKTYELLDYSFSRKKEEKKKVENHQKTEL